MFLMEWWLSWRNQSWIKSTSFRSLIQVTIYRWRGLWMSVNRLTCLICGVRYRIWILFEIFLFHTFLSLIYFLDVSVLLLVSIRSPVISIFFDLCERPLKWPPLSYASLLISWLGCASTCCGDWFIYLLTATVLSPFLLRKRKPFMNDVQLSLCSEDARLILAKERWKLFHDLYSCLWRSHTLRGLNDWGTMNTRWITLPWMPWVVWLMLL